MPSIAKSHYVCSWPTSCSEEVLQQNHAQPIFLKGLRKPCQAHNYESMSFETYALVQVWLSMNMLHRDESHKLQAIIAQPLLHTTEAAKPIKTSTTSKNEPKKSSVNCEEVGGNGKANIVINNTSSSID
ncbi:hypothetical protein ACE6H2_001946 [Prunus campanulata]